jgi:uncharacterized protein (TIGR04255 family)
MELKEYESRILVRSPLILVAVQINFEEVAREISHAQARAFQREIGSEWVQLQAAPLVTTTITSTGVPIQEPNRQAWRIATEDEKWSIFLRPDNITMETQNYARWEQFSERFAVICAAAATVFDPAVRFRIGLRYVDKIPMPEGKESWDGLISNSLLGMASDSQFKDGILASDQRVLIQYSDGIRCLLRHGIMPEAEVPLPFFLLDFDVFTEGKDRFDVSDIATVSENLHLRVGQTFRTCLTDEMYELLKGGS